MYDIFFKRFFYFSVWSFHLFYIFAPENILSYGVMVAQQILVLFV